jgi:hypothetical protein
VAAYRFRAHLTEGSVSPLVSDDDNHICGETSVYRHTRLTVTLTVTGANTGEQGETWNLRIRRKQAVFETAANSSECKETNSGSVSEGSNPSPAAPSFSCKIRARQDVLVRTSCISLSLCLGGLAGGIRLTIMGTKQTAVGDNLA